jgi:hypothetical protein
VPFDGRAAKFYDSTGHEIWRWVKFGMPKLGQYSWILDFVCFLYESSDDARNGVNSGGTGFFVSVPSKRWPDRVHHTHVISNWHVTTGGPPPPCPVVRINRHDGAIETVEYHPDDWHYIQGGADIVVSPPLYLQSNIHKVASALIDVLITAEQEKEVELGAADDVFMVGRFVDYEGVDETVPAFRFGHISIADARIRQITGYQGRSIVADMHSRTGFSGSPVFYWRTSGTVLPDSREGKGLKSGNILVAGHELRIIGIHYGQFPESWELKTKDNTSTRVKHHQALITEGAYIEGLSGMTCIAPAQDIIDLLNKPELAAMREAKEIEYEANLGGRPIGPKMEKASRQNETPAEPEGDNPEHKEDFTRLLGVAAKAKPQASGT